MFSISACAQVVCEDTAPLPAGGFGTGHFVFDRSGAFRGWRLHPGVPKRDEAVPSDRFHVWVRQGGRTSAWALVRGSTPALEIRRLQLFPLTWTRFTLPGLPLDLESLVFSPLLPGRSPEISLPIYVTVWHARNATDDSLEVALMLTWVCAWPEPVPSATFDFQQDNLCLTGSLGDPQSPNRMGIAVPDLHHAGIYRQGIEPWDATGDGAEVYEDFAEDGELDPTIVRCAPQGAAAWVKFDLNPGETKEIPFLIVWHFPFYESGPACGVPRYYTRLLGKRRPDNAVVWLAEQAVQDYGGEAANYRYWMQQIEDWHRSVLRGAPEEQARRLNSLAALLAVDTVWTEDGRFWLLLREGQTCEELRSALAEALPVREVWPHIAEMFGNAL
ncbi:MAG TPA: GH116 family glycosyl-hydrolase [Chthonomonadales bacterium]|nr:GH116 family glycosyl-hydrolase [Chthonomonadales bacterium]